MRLAVHLFPHFRADPGPFVISFIIHYRFTINCKRRLFVIIHRSKPRTNPHYSFASGLEKGNKNTLKSNHGKNAYSKKEYCYMFIKLGKTPYLDGRQSPVTHNDWTRPHMLRLHYLRCSVNSN